MSGIIERAHAWIVGRDTGSSSEAIWAVMMGMKPDWDSHPHDGDDLGRCLRLLDLIPEWKLRLGEMAVVYPYWAALVEHWDELAAHAQDRHVYDRMRKILDPIEAKDCNVVRMGTGISMRFGK
jgi:hypothetical protein